MSVNLTKGESVELGKETPLTKVTAGAGWDAKAEGAQVDLDLSVVAVAADGKIRSEDDFVYFRHLKNADGTIEHTGDNLTGEGDGDDEQIKVSLETLPANIVKLSFIINSYSGQAFGDVKNAFARLVQETGKDADGNPVLTELVRYDLGAEYASEKAVEMAHLTREAEGWKFTAVGRAFPTIKEAVAQYGING